MPDKLITIAKYNDFLSADIDRQILEDNGIKASVSGQSASGVFSGLPTLSYVELQVFEQDAEKALEILSEILMKIIFPMRTTLKGMIPSRTPYDRL
jgi:hypothetical protein